MAYGGGIPPWWCRTAAAAEAWALYIVLSFSVSVPVIKTDCLALLHNAQAGMAVATSASKMLARIWNLIGGIVDGDLSELADSQRLVWIPAHQGFGAIRSRILSNGRHYSVIDWRANRLVDAIANCYANDIVRLEFIFSLTMSARAAVRHSVALLGCVTHAANNHVVQVTREDGTTLDKVKRDVTEHSRKRARREESFVEPPGIEPALGQHAKELPCSGCRAAPMSGHNAALRARSQTLAAHEHNKRTRLLDEQRLRERVAAIGDMCTASPSPSGSAADRLQAVAARVKARAVRL